MSIRFTSLPNNLLQQLVALLLFRCGGQQTFAPEEITDIQSSIAGVTMIIDRDYKITLRCRTPEYLASIEQKLAQEEDDLEGDDDKLAQEGDDE